jgi:transcriptional regulator with XRE-family HTH domain
MGQLGVPDNGYNCPMTPYEIGQMILRARESRQWAQEELGRQAGGVGQSTIDRIEKGRFKRMPSDLPRICAALGLDLPSLNDRVELPSLPPKKLMGERNFPIYASVEGGPGEIIRQTDPVDWVPRPAPVIHVKEAYGLLVTGMSMWPEYKPGETALINPLLPIVSDEVYVFYAELEGEARATIKHLRRATHDAWQVTQHNPPPRKPREFSLPKKEWRWAHRVLGKYTRP